MSVTIGTRTLIAFVTGAAACLLAVFMFQTMRADAAAGHSDSTFVPVTPCRLIDTRPAPVRVGPLGKLGADDTETVLAHGSNGKCTIPADAVGLSMNVTAVNATRLTDVRIWPSGAKPLAASLNPSPAVQVSFNAVSTPLSGAGSFEVYNFQGSVDLIIDVNGYYTKSSLQDLESRLVALESKTAAMSVEDAGSTVRFSGVDVQIVDGSGDTRCGDLFAMFEACNGSGNLIVGYNEDEGGDEERTGSHNIVAGTDNDYTSHSGIVAGRFNTASGEYSTVTGGSANEASGPVSSVTGGENNISSNYGSSVVGGANNLATVQLAVVSGGFGNTASGIGASVSGGSANAATDEFSSVSGGSGNTASGNSSFVAGGRQNIASGGGSSVSGGDSNEAKDEYDVAVGGFDNVADGPRAVAVGGGENSASGSKSVVSGGSLRTSTSTFDWRAGSLLEDS